MKDRNKGIIGAFLILVALGLGLWQWNIRSSNLISIQALSAEANGLVAQENLLNKRYEEIKPELNAARESAGQQIEAVFPTNDDVTNLTRLFDDFEVKNNFDSNPFLINSVNYLNPLEEDNYRILPMTMQITASKKNFLKFLEYIESSGSLESEVRLMSVESITVKYPDTYGGIYDVGLQINAYFSREI
ncbi:hypothetical protein KKC94_02090 [Patescibacteria group bacterium]|nr:hypothetical protein [Patescibacteria group bacterium]